MPWALPETMLAEFCVPMGITRPRVNILFLFNIKGNIKFPLILFIVMGDLMWYLIFFQ